MKVWKFWPHESVAWIMFADDFSAEAAFEVKAGSSLSARWPDSVRFEKIEELGGRDLIPVESPWFMSYTMAFNESAMSRMLGICGPDGEFLPVAVEDEVYFLMNVTRTPLGAIDLARSDVTYLGPNRVGMISKYEFDAEAIGDARFFRCPETDHFEVYATDSVIEDLGFLGISGITPMLIWDSETTVPPVDVRRL